MIRNQCEYRQSSWTADEGDKITGYAVVFNSRAVLFKDPYTGEEYGEVIDAGALTGADMSDVILNYNHGGRVLARTRNHTLRLAVDSHGLKIEADMNTTEEAKSLYGDVKAGLVDKMSFAFTIADESYDEATKTRHIKKIDKVFDVSLVSNPVYEDTEVHARSQKIFENLAKPDRRAKDIADVRSIHDSILERMGSFSALDRAEHSDFMSAEELAQGLERAKEHPAMFRGQLDECEPIYREMCQIRESWESLRSREDIVQARADKLRYDALESQIKAIAEKRNKARQAVAAGAGTTIRSFDGFGAPNERKENNMNDINTEKRSFYEGLLQKRAAGAAADMAAVIPSTVYDALISKAPGAFLRHAHVMNIKNNGKITVPVWALDTVTAHVENADLAVNGDAPTGVEILHQEYAYLTSYSDQSIATSVEDMEKMVTENLMESHNKAMDKLLLDKVAALEYTPKTNAVQISGAAPTYAEFVELAGYLGDDFTDNAEWYMAPSTYYKWLCGLTDTAKRPILDASLPVENQAFLGRRINLDSNVPADTVYFGAGSGLYLNHANGPEVLRDDNFRKNSVDFKVRSVSGAAAVSGCFVKMFPAG